MAHDNLAQQEGPSAYPQALPGTGRQAATLELSDVTKIYPDQPRPALAHLNLAVDAGEVCVLVGPSGSGKTTAMRLINRMIPLSGGDILIGGKSVLERNPVALRREIGYVIQQIGLFPHLSINENIATVPRLLGWGGDRVSGRVRELLELVGLEPEIGRRYPAQLSGGQRQRVGVARALAGDPPLLLMDEPFGAIDPINRHRLQDEFMALQQRLRKTVVFVTHDIDEAIKLGDRIAILREGGELAQYDTPAEILTQPADEFVAQFVGADRALKRLGLDTLAEVELLDADAVDAGERRVALTTSLRDTLSQVLNEGGAPLAVVDGEETVGAVTLELLGGLLKDGALSAAATGQGSPR